MGVRNLLAVGFIFAGFSVGWMILGVVNAGRTEDQTRVLLERVQNAYGGPMKITPPQIYYEVIKERKGKVGGFKTVSSYKQKEFVDPSRSDIDIDLKLKRRKIGNLWFPVFLALYQGVYEYDVGAVPEKYQSQALFLLPGLSSSESIYRSIEMKINGVEVQPLSKLVASTPMELAPEMRLTGKVKVEFQYETTGTDHMLYVLAGQQQSLPKAFRDDVGSRGEHAQVKRLTRLDNFSAKLKADFEKYDFPNRTIPPTKREKHNRTNQFEWHFDKAVTGKNIGLIVPDEMNPGDIAARISFFAPVSLLFFVVVMVIFGILSRRELHPMHYFFLAATFLSFHLVFAYSADHISKYSAFSIAALVSCLLTFSYLARVDDWKHATISMLLQLLYLVVLSLSFFYRSPTGLGITGLIVTIISVITLFVLMQLTSKIDWEEAFARNLTKENKGF